MMQVLGIRATLFDFLEHQACEEDKAKGLDIADSPGWAWGCRP